MNVFVIRHGRAKHNDEGLWNDTPAVHMPLTQLGIEQAHEAAEKLKAFKPDVIFVSELQRTQETAEIINRFHAAPIVVDRRINEQSAGGKVQTYKEFLEVIQQDRFNYRFEGGESYQDMKKRIHHFLDELRTKSYKIVFIVSHGDPIQIMHAYFHKLSDEETLLLRVKNCEIFEFEI